ncbi:hypothetical protein YOLOSWAG_77 [Erwinia phage vB_EamM_Yoloswag]|uniref:Uncharacterized protein n=1 Tax=Erwinia phage vB_EamM_Yoloswag TaxID=1958956 RepID=A0A1S6L304_9CAUD|nr:hypothetical protein HOR66_gp077 [Erwinia phage vB_EamM_Yoloswag]AQT28560.1 hypothetical protein YOLOSWAG_77 [Erwinia phage vB_EamM_Yoloswag]
MNLKLFNVPMLNQLSRLFGSTTYDTKNVYLVALALGKTVKDLNACLNYHATGAGYSFDTTRMSGICTLLGTSTDCTRAFANNVLSVSEINITTTATGRPTHIVLGGILPIALEIGTDVNLLYPNSELVIDVTAAGSVVYCPAFNLSMTNILGLSSWLAGNELLAIDSTVFYGAGFNDYAGNVISVQAGTVADTSNGIDMNNANPAMTTSTAGLDVTQSFTIDFKYRQSATTKFPDFSFFSLFSSTTVRWAIGLEPGQNQFAIWNQAVTAKVSRPIDNYAALKSTTFVTVKYVYDATTNLHRVFINDQLVDSFTYVNIKPNTTVHRIGGSGAYDATVHPFIDNFRVRQGVFL